MNISENAENPPKWIQIECSPIEEKGDKAHIKGIEDINQHH